MVFLASQELENEMERRDVVLAHWLEFQNGDDADAGFRNTASFALSVGSKAGASGTRH